MGRLKDMITAKSVSVNVKFQSPFTAPSFTNFFLLSNFELSSILEPSDRRFDVFHAAEEKMNQDLFGDLADISNDGVWLDRSPTDQDLRRHAIYALRQMLLNYKVSLTFDREEATLNEVKQELIASQNPPAMDWMFINLPMYFTDDIVMVACQFCPMRVTPDYVMKQLKEHFGPRLQPVFRPGAGKLRLNAAPKLEIRHDGSGDAVMVLNFDTRSSDPAARKYVMTFGRLPRDSNPSDQQIKMDMHKWYTSMVTLHYSSVRSLPQQKPGTDNAELI
jgi:hypothetical protein